MKRFKFEIEKVTGKTDVVVVEGMNEKDAVLLMSRQKFVTDLKTAKMVNMDHVVSLTSLGEVKSE